MIKDNKNNTFHALRDSYVKIGISLVEKSNHTNDILLHESLIQLQKKYISEVLQLPKSTIIDLQNRNLLSLEKVKKQLCSKIAIALGFDGLKINTVKSLIDVLRYSDNSNLDFNTDVPEPMVLGKVIDMGVVVLPPDIRKSLSLSMNLFDKNIHTAGFDKVGFIEERLSIKLNIDRKLLTWKRGILHKNQMREVSYYHIYLSQYNKSLLINNQYGEAIFIIHGDFNTWESQKSDLKKNTGVIVITFDYKQPQNTLEELNKSLFVNDVLHEDTSIIQPTKEEIIKYMRDKFPTVGDFDALQMRKGEGGWLQFVIPGIGGVRKIGTILGIKGIQMRKIEGKYEVRKIIYPEELALKELTKEEIIKYMREKFPTVEAFDAIPLRKGENGRLQFSIPYVGGVRRIGAKLGIGEEMQAIEGKYAVRKIIYPQVDIVEELTKEEIIKYMREKFPTVEDFDAIPLRKGEEGRNRLNIPGFGGVVKIGTKLGLGINNKKMTNLEGKNVIRNILYSNKGEH